MRRTWSIFLFEHEQPDNRTRRALRRLVGTWNRDRTPPFESLAGAGWHAGFDESTVDRLDPLRTLLTDHGIEHHFSWRDHVEDEDYATADFIAVLGASPNLEFPFLRNETTAFVPAPPCQLCGSTGAYGVVQVEPLAIDATQLGRSLADLPPPGPAGWELIILPAGQLLLSTRLAAAMADNQVRGYHTSPVIDAATGEPSRHLVQLVADKSILVPCPEHTKVDLGPFCPGCGMSYGVLDGYFRIQDSWVGEDEVLSRDLDKGSMLYVSARLYDILSTPEPNGADRHDVMMICRH